MSAEQDSSVSDDEQLAEVLRAAEQAVDQVRNARDRGDLDDLSIDDDDDEAIEIDDADQLDAKLAAAEAEAAALKDKWLRSVAELDNYKKRVKRDIDDAVHRAVQGLLGDFLSVGDNLERALSVVPSEADEKLAPLTKGLEMVRQEFFSALRKHGIDPIQSVGQVFDPNLHDALQQMSSPEYAPGVVMLEYEKGYRRGDKLLRPARVIVAGPDSTGQKGASNTGGAESGDN